jgi:acyl-CoA reductase-like NAD-dependent aldehyde dehydrogenase
MPISERSKLLLAASRLITQRAEELAVMETMEQGSPLRKTKSFDIPQCAEQLEYFAGVARGMTGETLPIGPWCVIPRWPRSVSPAIPPPAKESRSWRGNRSNRWASNWGENAFILLPDADIDAAVEGAVFSAFQNSGQVCAAATRFYVHDTVYERFAEKFVAGAAKLRMGDPMTKHIHLDMIGGPERPWYELLKQYPVFLTLYPNPWLRKAFC